MAFGFKVLYILGSGGGLMLSATGPIDLIGFGLVMGPQLDSYSRIFSSSISLASICLTLYVKLLLGSPVSSVTTCSMSLKTNKPTLSDGAARKFSGSYGSRMYW